MKTVKLFFLFLAIIFLVNCNSYFYKTNPYSGYNYNRAPYSLNQQNPTLFYRQNNLYPYNINHEYPPTTFPLINRSPFYNPQPYSSINNFSVPPVQNSENKNNKTNNQISNRDYYNNIYLSDLYYVITDNKSYGPASGYKIVMWHKENRINKSTQLFNLRTKTISTLNDLLNK